MTQIDLFENVAVPLPFTLYLAVKVVLPELSPVTTNDALACCRLLPRRTNARVSVAAIVVAPLTANDMNMLVEPLVACVPDVTDTSALPEPGVVAGIVAVTAGPVVARST